MAKKPTVTTLASGFNSTETLNANFEALRDGFDNTLSLDGSTPNAMGGDLDLNSNNIINATAIMVGGSDVVATTATALAAAVTAQADAEAAVVASALSETNAANSATAASGSANTASSGAILAVQSRIAANSSENSAASSASTATTKAGEASASATAAAASEAGVDADRVAAQTAATNAATSETNAATSATNAETSRTDASLLSGIASTSATAAATSAVAASEAKTAAETAETNASTSETNASTSETNASTSEANAATSETNAATSASTATTKATEASTSATNASTSAASAQAAKDAALEALDSFDDRYLGQKTIDPTVDNDGDALVSGALYFNTTDDIMKVYDGSLWVAAYASLSGAMFGANNLSDVADAAGSRQNLGLGTGDSPTFAGLTTTADVSFGDNDKATFGAGSDLQIYHDGTHSYIEESGGIGNLQIRSDSKINIAKSPFEYMASFVADGAVTLYYDNADKLATTSTGVDVTGTITSDGLTVDAAVATIQNNDIDNGATLRLDNSTSSSSWGLGKVVGTLEYYLSSDTSTTEPIRAKIELAQNNTTTQYPAQADLNFHTTSSNALQKNMTIASTGDISFYEDTGTTAKFFWDASAESLSIGSKAFITADANVGYFGGSAAQSNHISFYDALDLVRIYTNGSEAMRIDSSGRILASGTSTNVASDATGSQFTYDGASNFLAVKRENASSAAAVAYFNRTGGHDGDIATFRKNGATVGSIGTQTPSEFSITSHLSYLDLLTNNNSDGLTYRDDTSQRFFGPYVAADNRIDLGRSNGRFKDLYLSGGVANPSGSLTFDTNGSERMRIDSSGNVGIGTSSPNHRFHLENYNASLAVISDVNGSSTIFLGNTADNNKGRIIYTQSIDTMKFLTNGSEAMRITSSNDLHVDGNVIAYSTTISDERLKTDIVKIDGALDKVDQLNGYTFTYTADGKKSAGVIAQEVEKVLPSAIVESTLPLKTGGDDETEYKTVQYDQLIGLLVEAVKELKAEVAELKGK